MRLLGLHENIAEDQIRVERVACYLIKRRYRYIFIYLSVSRLTRSQRTTFDEALDPVPYRPTRKFTRVLGAQSVSTGHEGLYVDAGLAFGRSFRVSWGPGGQLAHIGGPLRCFCRCSNHVLLLTVLISSVIHVDIIPMAADEEVSQTQLYLFTLPEALFCSL